MKILLLLNCYFLLLDSYLLTLERKLVIFFKDIGIAFCVAIVFIVFMIGVFTIVDRIHKKSPEKVKPIYIQLK